MGYGLKWGWAKGGKMVVMVISLRERDREKILKNKKVCGKVLGKGTLEKIKMELKVNEFIFNSPLSFACCSTPGPFKIITHTHSGYIRWLILAILTHSVFSFSLSLAPPPNPHYRAIEEIIFRVCRHPKIHSNFYISLAIIQSCFNVHFPTTSSSTSFYSSKHLIYKKKLYPLPNDKSKDETEEEEEEEAKNN